jgi:hypothetical protein
VNIYNLLRMLIKNSAASGGWTKAQVYDALTLIDELEKVNGFGHILTVTKGSHEYQPSQKFTGPYTVIQQCGICGKKRDEHHE